jgi:hypothetical protein
MKKPLPKRDAERRPAPPARLDRRTVVIDRARHEIGGEARVVEAVKVALVDLNARREVEVSYALRLEGFLSAPFSKKHEVVKALKEGDLEAFLKDLAPIPDAPAAPAVQDAPSGDATERIVSQVEEILAEDEATRADVVPTSDAA